MMAMEKDVLLEEIREALAVANNLPIVVLPQYFLMEGNVLPGIGIGGQILTREELRGLTDDEVMECRFRYVMLFAPRISREFMKHSKESKTA